MLSHLCIFSVLASALLLTGCRSSDTTTQQPRPAIVGTIRTTSPINSPYRAVLELRLIDITDRTTEKVISEQTRSDLGEPPLRFRLTYDPRQINPEHDYAVQARIITAGRTTFGPSDRIPVLTRKRPVLIEITLSKNSE